MSFEELQGKQSAPTFYIGPGMWVMVTSIMSTNDIAGVLTVGDVRLGIEIKFEEKEEEAPPSHTAVMIRTAGIKHFKITAVMGPRPVEIFTLNKVTGDVLQSFQMFTTVLCQAWKDNVFQYPG